MFFIFLTTFYSNRWTISTTARNDG